MADSIDNEAHVASDNHESDSDSDEFFKRPEPSRKQLKKSKKKRIRETVDSSDDGEDGADSNDDSSSSSNEDDSDIDQENAGVRMNKKKKKFRRIQIENDDSEDEVDATKKIQDDPPGPSDKLESEDEDEDEDEAKDEQAHSPKNDDDQPQEDEEEENDDEISDDGVPQEPAPLYDFDIMMAKKKEENSKKRRRRNYDIINDNDDIIADIINQMRDAVEADIESNKSRIAATNKLKLLPFVMSQLRKVDLRDAFLDSDVLSVISEWLAPLPDRSLPHLNIRENLLKMLIDFNLYDVDRIKSSGIGKSVMYLYKHPRETKENKQRAKQLISSWSRPIFNLDASFTAISREEREERDLELMKRQRRVSQQESSDGDNPGPSGSSKKKPKETEPTAQKPGEKGWIPRARVPAPSMRDYVVRPRSKVDGDVGKSSKRPSNMLEKLMKTHQERRRAGKQQRAVTMNIDRG